MRKKFRENLAEGLNQIIDNLKTIEDRKQGQYVIELIQYIFNIDDEHQDINDFIQIIQDKLPPELEQEIMNLAESIERKGKMEGKLESKKEIALNLLSEGVDPVFIAKVTKLPLEKIKQLAKNKE